MNCRVRLQLVEALGPVNRWFCSEAYGRKIEDPEVLLAYFVKSGGAADFARRYAQAMGLVNRWYCSEFHCRDIRDPEILWEYYTSLAPVRAVQNDPRYQRSKVSAEMSMAC